MVVVLIWEWSARVLTEFPRLAATSSWMVVFVVGRIVDRGFVHVGVHIAILACQGMT